MTVKENFSELAKEWAKNIPQKNFEIARDLIRKSNIKEGDSVLDVAAGTGILFSILKDKGLSNYVAVDITDKMVEEFLRIYPGIDVRCQDYEKALELEQNFDYIIIFNSIPHFNDYDAVFANSYNNLNEGGKFIICHARTRDGLKEHRKKIGYPPDKEEPIPTDAMLSELCERHGFNNITIEDEEYFLFCCQRRQ
nr:class I SAM-dependent methyltransferase [Lutispora saccharofermentans]